MKRFALWSTLLANMTCTNYIISKLRICIHSCILLDINLINAWPRLWIPEHFLYTAISTSFLLSAPTCTRRLPFIKKLFLIIVNQKDLIFLLLQKLLSEMNCIIPSGKHTQAHNSEKGCLSHFPLLPEESSLNFGDVKKQEMAYYPPRLVRV